MRLLDLFCGAGGCAVGYARAGFTEIVGVDIAPQPRYPFAFVQADAMEYMRLHAHAFDAIHASPPCQDYSITKKGARGRVLAAGKTYQDRPRLIAPLREFLAGLDRPWIIENVPGSEAELGHSVTLCGLMFGLKLFRHRHFASNVRLIAPVHPSHRGHLVGANGIVCMVARGDTNRGRIPADHRSKAAWVAASGIDWMTRDEMAQAIPPAYTEFLGRQLLAACQPGAFAAQRVPVRIRAVGETPVSKQGKLF